MRETPSCLDPARQFFSACKGRKNCTCLSGGRRRFAYSPVGPCISRVLELLQSGSIHHAIVQAQAVDRWIDVGLGSPREREFCRQGRPSKRSRQSDCRLQTPYQECADFGARTGQTLPERLGHGKPVARTPVLRAVRMAHVALSGPGMVRRCRRYASGTTRCSIRKHPSHSRSKQLHLPCFRQQLEQGRRWPLRRHNSGFSAGRVGQRASLRYRTHRWPEAVRNAKCRSRASNEERIARNKRLPLYPYDRR